eukprot:scaffold532279_cov45-Prasinocladus_malaysianus.AAC.1
MSKLANGKLNVFRVCIQGDQLSAIMRQKASSVFVAHLVFPAKGGQQLVVAPAPTDGPELARPVKALQPNEPSPLHYNDFSWVLGF